MKTTRKSAVPKCGVRDILVQISAEKKAAERRFSGDFRLPETKEDKPGFRSKLEAILTAYQVDEIGEQEASAELLTLVRWLENAQRAFFRGSAKFFEGALDRKLVKAIDLRNQLRKKIDPSAEFARTSSVFDLDQAGEMYRDTKTKLAEVVAEQRRRDDRPADAVSSKAARKAARQQAKLTPEQKAAAEAAVAREQEEAEERQRQARERKLAARKASVAEFLGEFDSRGASAEDKPAGPAAHSADRNDTPMMAAPAA